MESRQKTALAIYSSMLITFLQDLDTKHQTLVIDTPMHPKMEMSYALYNVRIFTVIFST